MNHMEQVAEMLGVEIGERFALELCGSKIGDFKFEKDGLYAIYDGGQTINNNAIALVLTGDLDIVKKPWLPKYSETYYTVDACGPVECNKWETIKEVWSDDSMDFVYYAAGNCFKTDEDARAAIPWMKENIERIKRGEPWKARE